VPDAEPLFTSIAHSAICVGDVDAATRWYAEVLGMRVLSPPYLMEGSAIERDMGELIPPPVAVKASIVGFEQSDRVLELIEYPHTTHAERAERSITEVGLTHVGVVCEDLERTRRALEDRGVEFLTRGNADVAGLRTAWFQDPWGTVFILLEKSHEDRPYWHQYGPLP
jgi:catechol 2,3-dioxygenase-like lactoylglutathione lyase family enzyme